MADTYSADIFRQCTGEPLPVCVSRYESNQTTA